MGDRLIPIEPAAASWNHRAGEARPIAEAIADRQMDLAAVADCPHRGPIHAEGCHCLRTCLAGKGRAGLVMATGETLTTVDDCLTCLGSPG